MGDLSSWNGQKPLRVFSSFWPKHHDPDALPSTHPFFPGVTFLFFVSVDEESPQRETYADGEEVKQNTAAAAQKGIKTNEIKICFE